MEGRILMSKFRKLSILLVIIVTTACFLLILNLENYKDKKNFQIQLSIKADSPISITDNNQFSALASQGDGNKSTPWIIENYYILANGSSQHGILIQDTTHYFILRNCTVLNTDDNYYGIYLNNVVNANITNNTVSHGLDYGIYLIYSDNNTIHNNTAFNNTRGIRLYDSQFNNITFNQAELNNQGFNIRNSMNNSIINNTANFNTEYGLYLESSSHYNVFINNTINNNYDNGFELEGSDFCNLTFNTLKHNKDWGAHLVDSYDCTIINNTFYNNSIPVYEYLCSGNTIENNNCTPRGPTISAYVYTSSINIMWGGQGWVEKYYIYRNNSPIISIEGMEPITEVSSPYGNYNDHVSALGDYYYVVVAQFNIPNVGIYNTTLSNCVKATVTSLQAPIPGFTLFFIIFGLLITCTAVWIFSKKNKISNKI